MMYQYPGMASPKGPGGPGPPHILAPARVRIYYGPHDFWKKRPLQTQKRNSIPDIYSVYILQVRSFNTAEKNKVLETRQKK